jgi:hypothetical protein
MASKQAAKKQSKPTDEQTETISCLCCVLPYNVESWSDFIRIIGINCFPIEMIPVVLNGKSIVCDDDDSYIIKETPNTLQLIEFKSVTIKGVQKYNVIFKIPIPAKDTPYYNYIMDEIVTPLTAESDERQLVRVYWSEKTISCYRNINQKKRLCVRM